MLIGRVGSILLAELRRMNGDRVCSLSAGLWHHSVEQPRKVTLPQLLHPLQPCCFSLLMWRTRTSENEGGAFTWERQIGRTWTQDLWMAKGVKREREGPKPIRGGMTKILYTLCLPTHGLTGGVSYQTKPKQRETRFPSMGKVLCTSPTAWPLHACIEVLHGHPRVSRITGGLAATLGMVRPAVKC